MKKTTKVPIKPVFCLSDHANQRGYRLQLSKTTPTGCVQRIGTGRGKPPSELWKKVNGDFEKAPRAAQKRYILVSRRRETLDHKYTSKHLILPIFLFFILDFITLIAVIILYICVIGDGYWEKTNLPVGKVGFQMLSFCGKWACFSCLRLD